MKYNWQGMQELADKISIEPNTIEPKSVPLYVDLDDCLLQTDLLWEGLIKLIKRKPWGFFQAIYQFTLGRSRLKAFLAIQTSIDFSGLPYRKEVIDLIHQKKSAGTKIILATASPMAWAQGVAGHLKLFDDVLASTEDINLKGLNKLKRIQEHASQSLQSGAKFQFDYVGDSSSDAVIWNQARSKYSVNWCHLLESGERPVLIVHKDGYLTKFVYWIKSLRIHQWAKNLLIFAPLVFAHQLNHLEKGIASGLAFVAMSLCASAIYTLNDIFDLEEDRHNPTKCKRSYAAGTLPLLFAPLSIILCLLGSFAIAIGFLGSHFILVLFLYLLVTTVYSMRLKQILLWDVMTLTFLYTIRLIAGGAATDIVVSNWLLSFSAFLFFGLALLKRFIEIQNLTAGGEVKGRGYAAEDLQIVQSFGITSSLISTVILALYISSDSMVKLYSHPEVLWLSIPIMFFWISRIWMLAHKKQVNSDPVLFAVKDPTSYIFMALLIAIIVGATVL